MSPASTRTSQTSEVDAAPQGMPPSVTESSSPEQAIISLQQSAGNGFVADLLTGGALPGVQRQALEEEELASGDEPPVADEVPGPWSGPGGQETAENYQDDDVPGPWAPADEEAIPGPWTPGGEEPGPVPPMPDETDVPDVPDGGGGGTGATPADGAGGAGGGGGGGGAGGGGADQGPPAPTGDTDDAGGGGGPAPDEGVGPAPDEATAEAPADTGAEGADTGSLALIDEELAEHYRWGSAGAAVGEAGSAERAQFVAESVGQEMGGAFAQSAVMAIAITGGTKVAERAAAKFIPVPAVGAMIGGIIAGAALWDSFSNWETGAGADIGAIGEGEGYEFAANLIQGIVTILDLAANIIDVIGGIAGAVAAGCWVVAIITAGAVSPLAATATAVATACGVAATILNIVKMALQPLVVLFRALHTYQSEADPRDVQAQGAGLASAGAGLAGNLGGIAGAAAAGHAAGRMEEAPARGPGGEDVPPPSPREDGPSVDVEPPTLYGPDGRPIYGDVEGPAPSLLDAEGRPLSGDVEGPAPSLLDAEGRPLSGDVEGPAPVILDAEGNPAEYAPLLYDSEGQPTSPRPMDERPTAPELILPGDQPAGSAPELVLPGQPEGPAPELVLPGQPEGPAPELILPGQEPAGPAPELTLPGAEAESGGGPVLDAEGNPAEYGPLIYDSEGNPIGPRPPGEQPAPPTPELITPESGGGGPRTDAQMQQAEAMMYDPNLVPEGREGLVYGADEDGAPRPRSERESFMYGSGASDSVWSSDRFMEGAWGMPENVATSADANDAVAVAQSVLGTPPEEAQSPYTADNDPFAHVEGGAEAQAEADANVERVNPAYEDPRATPQELAQIQSDIEVVLAERAQAEQAALEMDQTADVADENASQADEVASRSGDALSATQAHQQLVQRRAQANEQQQQRQEQAGAGVEDAGEELAGLATLKTLLAGWEAFTGLFSLLPGAAGDKAAQLSREAADFQDKLGEAETTIADRQASHHGEQGVLVGNAAAIDATDTQNESTQETVTNAQGDAQSISEDQAELSSEATEVAGECRDQAGEAADTADEAQAEHDSLAEELQEWAEEHQRARRAAIDDTIDRLEAEGYVVVGATDW